MIVDMIVALKVVYAGGTFKMKFGICGVVLGACCPATKAPSFCRPKMRKIAEIWTDLDKARIADFRLDKARSTADHAIPAINSGVPSGRQSMQNAAFSWVSNEFEMPN